MSKPNKKNEIKEETVKQEEAPKQEETAADQTSEETPKQDVQEEQKAPEIMTSHPQMCDPAFFGHHDPFSDECKGCVKEFPECGAACIAYTNSLKVKAKAPKAPRAPRQPKAEGTVTRGRMRGNYAGKKLNEISTEHTTVGRLARAIYAAGVEGLEVASYDTGGIPMSGYKSYFKREGFEVEIVNGRAYDRTDFPATPAA